MAGRSTTVDRHYGRHGDLAGRILEALREAGADLEALTPAELTPLDQFHVRGHTATEELAELAELGPNASLLDVGCGVGGPARRLAEAFGCTVTGLDLTEAYCASGAALTGRVGLAARVRFVCGDATALPFPADCFDVVWSQHTAMNIPDKAALYREMARVLRPAGRVVLYDIVAGANQPIHLPVPWAAKAEWSFLESAAAVRRLLEAAGLEVVVWRDLTGEALAWSRDGRRRAAAGEGPSLDRQKVMGPEFAEMFANLGRNLEEGRVEVIQARLVKPA